MLQRLGRRPPTGVVLAVLLVVGIASGTAAAEGTPVPFTDGFESGGTAVWPRKGVEAGGAVDVTTAPGGGNGKAARFTMPDDGSYRAEIATSRLPYGSYRYSFSNHLPGTWVRYENMTIVSQWHGGTDTIPAIALAVKNDRWMMDIHWQVGSQPVQGLKYDLGAVAFGHWNRWTFDITWSTATTPGSIAAWRDGVPVGSHQGPNSYHQETAPYHKIGLYRPNWKAQKGHVKGGSPTVVAYYDDVSITALSPGSGKPPTSSAPGRPAASVSASESPTASAPPSAPATAAEAPASAAAAEDLPADNDIDTEVGVGTDTEVDGDTLAGTRETDHTPVILVCAGALLATGLLIAVRSRSRARRSASR